MSMPGFYSTPIQIVRPAILSAAHGRGNTLSYDVEDGATVLDVAEPVELQPSVRVELDDQTRVATQSGWELQTQPGVDIDLRPTDRIRCSIGDLDVSGEVKRWPGPEWPSGIDHVEVTCELRTG